MAVLQKTLGTACHRLCDVIRADPLIHAVLASVCHSTNVVVCPE